MGSSDGGQTYCLRWNNHKANLVEILDALIKGQTYVDCTIYVDRAQFKAHRVILAANSSYFQTMLKDVPMDHCCILFPGVHEHEMRALLEYMYTGEVNVTQSQIPRIMKIAEELEVKGLYDITDLKGKFDKLDEPIQQQQSTYNHHNMHHHHSSGVSGGAVGSEGGSGGGVGDGGIGAGVGGIGASDVASGNIGNTLKQQNHQSSPIISTSTNISSAQSSSSSPPYTYKSPYNSIYSCSPVHHQSSGNSNNSERQHHSAQWLPPVGSASHSIPTAATAMLSSYDTSDMNPLKRKKLSSKSSMQHDTPILRTVLAQPNAADSSQFLPLVCQPVKSERNNSDSHSNYSNGNDYSSDKKYKQTTEEPHSPYTDKSYEDDSMETSQNFSMGGGSGIGGSSGGGSMGDSRIASYVPQQKPEWKRYKQYTRTDITSAIECVRNGMSALQASRKFGVPSRTLYDKVKKLGITTGRPMNNRSIKRSPSNSSNPAPFPYGLSGASLFSHHNQDIQVPSQSQQHDDDRESDRGGDSLSHHLSSIPHSAAALLDPTFLQQALEVRGGSDIAGREALHAMALAAAAHAAVNGISTSRGAHGTSRSPSPSVLMKYMRTSTPSINSNNNNNSKNSSKNHHSNGSSNGGIMEDEDMVEDLSMAKREPSEKSLTPSPRPSSVQLQTQPQSQSPHQLSPQPPQQGVIVPPITKIVSPIAIIKDEYQDTTPQEGNAATDRSESEDVE